jgi:predicted CXXCH cytochrome family protein
MRAHTKVLIGASAAFLLSLAGTAQAQTGGNTPYIAGSDHNFSGNGWAQGEICLPCHTTHNTDTSITNAPLWNHELVDPATTYTLYGGASGVVRDDALDGFSILCMGCHDGTVALDSFGGKTGTNFMTGGHLIGTDLSNDHPVGATGEYPTAASVTWFQPLSTWVTSRWGLVTMPDPANPGSTIDVVSCVTCHEPHNAGGFDEMLRVSNASSALCLTCHIK